MSGASSSGASGAAGGADTIPPEARDAVTAARLAVTREIGDAAQAALMLFYAPATDALRARRDDFLARVDRPPTPEELAAAAIEVALVARRPTRDRHIHLHLASVIAEVLGPAAHAQMTGDVALTFSPAPARPRTRPGALADGPDPA